MNDLFRFKPNETSRAIPRKLRNIFRFCVHFSATLYDFLSILAEINSKIHFDLQIIKILRNTEPNQERNVFISDNCVCPSSDPGPLYIVW